MKHTKHLRRIFKLCLCLDCFRAGKGAEFIDNKLCGRPPQYAPAPVTFDLLTLKVVSESRVTWAIPLCQF